MAFKHKDYTLYETQVKLKNGKVHPVHFFAKDTPKSGKALNAIPAGKEIGVNKRTGLPFLRNK